MQRNLKGRSAQFYREESGSSLVELAFTLIVSLTALLGVIDGSRALYASHFAAYAAREATRYAMVRGSTWSGTTCSSTTTFQCDATAANVLSYVQSITPLGLDSGAPLQVATSWSGSPSTTNGGSCTGGNSPGCLVVVTVSYSFSYLTPFLPQTSWLLTSTSKAVISE